jgi:hypothetical protein
VEACFVLFGDNANLTHNRCMVCSKRTIGSKIVLHGPDGTASDVGLVESCSGPFGNSVSVGAR